MKKPLKKFRFRKMYSRTKDGKIRSFSIICRYYGEHEVVMSTKKRIEPDGKITYDKYTYTEGKNIGRANETSALEQCLMEADSMVNRLKDKGYSIQVPTITQYIDPKPMLAIKEDESKIKFPCMIQPKLDGVRCIMYEDSNKEVHLMSRRGKELNIPHIKAYLEQHRELLPLDGELYNHDSLSFQGIISAVKKLSNKTDHISVVVYDKPIPDVPNKLRQEVLEYIKRDQLHDKDPIKVLDTYYCNSPEDIEKYHKQFTSMGYEGSIIRNCDGLYEFGYRSHNLIKKKDFFDEEFPIVDVLEATGRDKGTAIFVLQAKNGKTFNARPQGDKQLRTQYLRDRKKLIGKPCTVKYQELSDYGIPRFPSAIAVRDYE